MWDTYSFADQSYALSAFNPTKWWQNCQLHAFKNSDSLKPICQDFISMTCWMVTDSLLKLSLCEWLLQQKSLDLYKTEVLPFDLDWALKPHLPIHLRLKLTVVIVLSLASREQVGEEGGSKLAAISWHQISQLWLQVFPGTTWVIVKQQTNPHNSLTITKSSEVEQKVWMFLKLFSQVELSS